MTENLGTKANPKDHGLNSAGSQSAVRQELEFDGLSDDDQGQGQGQEDLQLDGSEHDIVDELPTDAWSYEVPRPWLSIDQAAFMLGRSTRAVERSILGRWGNKLPEGWSARRVKIDGIEEWRIIPPPGFRIKHFRSEPREKHEADIEFADVDASPVEVSREGRASESKKRTDLDEDSSMPPQARSTDSGFSLEKLFHSASQMAQKELASFGLAVRPNQADRFGDDVEHATIVIDRSDEVEKLLRELSETRKELAEQRRMHLDDLRVMHEMQTSMRLLEVNARETAELKQDLGYAQKALLEHKKRYEEFVSLPWWKKIFAKLP